MSATRRAAVSVIGKTTGSKGEWTLHHLLVFVDATGPEDARDQGERQLKAKHPEAAILGSLMELVS